MPPFGSVFGMQTFMDESLNVHDIIDFNAGLRTHSVSMGRKDYVDAERPVVASFTT